MGDVLEIPLLVVLGATLVLLGLGLVCCGLTSSQPIQRLPGALEPQPATQSDIKRQRQLLKSYTSAALASERQTVATSRSPTTSSSKECIICLENPREVLLPCGHSTLCRKCVKSVLASSSFCPSCRAPFVVYKAVNSPPLSFRHLPVIPNDLKPQHKPLIPLVYFFDRHHQQATNHPPAHPAWQDELLRSETAQIASVQMLLRAQEQRGTEPNAPTRDIEHGAHNLPNSPRHRLPASPTHPDFDSSPQQEPELEPELYDQQQDATAGPSTSTRPNGGGDDDDIVAAVQDGGPVEAGDADADHSAGIDDGVVVSVGNIAPSSADNDDDGIGGGGGGGDVENAQVDDVADEVEGINQQSTTFVDISNDPADT